MNQAEITCPKCKKQNPAGILYGMPAPFFGKKDDEKDNIVFGGCSDYGYDYECQNCFYQWAEKNSRSGEYNEDKAMTEEGEFKNGQRHGLWITRTRLGIKYMEMSYNMGKPEGKIIYYDEEGLITQECFPYSDDVENIKVLYDKKGNVRAIHGGDIWIHDHEVNNYKVIETPKGFQVIPSN